jgi:hypothetical protein
LDVAGDRTMSSETEVAPGTTIHRLLARLVLEQPAVGGLYDPATRRLAEGVRLAVNGRNYELVGGLTYFLADADRLSFTRE